MDVAYAEEKTAQKAYDAPSPLISQREREEEERPVTTTNRRSTRRGRQTTVPFLARLEASRENPPLLATLLPVLPRADDVPRYQAIINRSTKRGTGAPQRTAERALLLTVLKERKWPLAKGAQSLVAATAAAESTAATVAVLSSLFQQRQFAHATDERQGIAQGEGNRQD